MVLIAFLGSGLGFQSCKALRHNQMPKRVGGATIRQRPGTTPPCVATALVVPALCLESADQNRIDDGSVRHPELICR
jgi:hypothetical protein